jgi:integrase
VPVSLGHRLLPGGHPSEGSVPPPGGSRRKISHTPVPVPASLIAESSGQIDAYGRHETLLTGEDRRQLSLWAIERAMRKARSKVKGLPAGFRYHDLRHSFASLLIADGADVKTVQARLRQASAKTTLDI